MAGRERVGQLCQMFQIWCNLLEQALNVSDVGSIVNFCEQLFDRQIALYEEYKDQFKNIYKDRVAEYFKRAPKRVVNVRGEGNSRTQESPHRLQTGLAVPAYAMQQHRDPKTLVQSKTVPIAGSQAPRALPKTGAGSASRATEPA